MFWLLTLPFRIVFGVLFGLLLLPVAIALLPVALVLFPLFLILWLPFAILRLALKLVFLPIVLLVTAVGLLVGGIAIVGTILIPLVPLAIVGGGLWLLWRLASGPSNAPVRF